MQFGNCSLHERTAVFEMMQHRPARHAGLFRHARCGGARIAIFDDAANCRLDQPRPRRRALQCLKRRGRRARRPCGYCYAERHAGRGLVSRVADCIKDNHDCFCFDRQPIAAPNSRINLWRESRVGKGCRKGCAGHGRRIGPRQGRLPHAGSGRREGRRHRYQSGGGAGCGGRNRRKCHRTEARCLVRKRLAGGSGRGGGPLRRSQCAGQQRRDRGDRRS